MTMAETASIMCETIVGNAALALAKDPQEELAIFVITSYSIHYTKLYDQVNIF